MLKVSVILPCYNVEKYITRCLDSLVNQTLKDIEIICVDDKSTDCTKSIIKQYVKQDKRIRLIELKKNCGVSSARNTGIKNANGQYIGFVDPDDYVDVDFYEKLYSSAKENNYADIAKAELKIIDNNNEYVLDIQNDVRKNKYAFLSSFSSGIYKHSLLIDNNILFPGHLTLTEDTCFLIKAVHYANCVVVVCGSFYNYIRHNMSADSKYYDYEKCCAAIKGYKYLYNWLNSVKPNDESYRIILTYICTLSLYPWNKVKSVKCKKRLAIGMCDIFTKEHSDVFENSYGRKLYKAVCSKDISKIINIMSMYLAEIKLFGKIKLGYVKVLHNHHIKIFNITLLTIEKKVLL